LENEMSNDLPPEAAYDASGNPLFTSDGNLGSAADAARFTNANLYAGGERLYEGDVFDGWGHKVRSAKSERGSTSWGSSNTGGSTSGEDPGWAVIGIVLALVGLLALLARPIDRWLMGFAKKQSQRTDELEQSLHTIQGLNFGGLLLPIGLLIIGIIFTVVDIFLNTTSDTNNFVDFLLSQLLSWLWVFAFLRVRFALLIFSLALVTSIIPCLFFIPLIMQALILIRGNEWAWYSGRWDKVEKFRNAKRRWIWISLGLVCIYFLTSKFI
jgi:hypothetical protein